jgi:hypothetical protein
MASKSKSHKKNLRLAYIAQRLSEAESDAQIVADVVLKYKVQETTARAELREVYKRWMTIDLDNQQTHKAKFMELGLNLLNEMRTNMAMGAVASHFKTLAQIAGVMTDKVIVTDSPRSLEPAPAPNTVRARIAELAKDPKIRARAARLGLDLDAIEVVKPEDSE